MKNTYILKPKKTCKQVKSNNTNEPTEPISKDEKHHLQITTLKNRKEQKK